MTSKRTRDECVALVERICDLPKRAQKDIENNHAHARWLLTAIDCETITVDGVTAKGWAEIDRLANDL